MKERKREGCVCERENARQQERQKGRENKKWGKSGRGKNREGVRE